MEVENREGYPVLILKGRIDGPSVSWIERHIEDLLQRGHVKMLLNFAQVTRLPSGGLRCLLSASRKCQCAGGLLVLVGVSEEVMEIIKMAGFEKVLHISANETDGILALRGEKNGGAYVV